MDVLQLPFEAAPAREMADTSLAAFERIQPSLTKRERVVFRALHRYVREYRRTPTSAELLDAMKRWEDTKVFAKDVNSVRPRLTGLDDKKWIEKEATVRNGGHTYRPVLPESAVPDEGLAPTKKLTRGRSTADRRAHIPEAAGSNPAA